MFPGDCRPRRQGEGAKAKEIVKVSPHSSFLLGTESEHPSPSGLTTTVIPLEA